jgi:hypothetical protein
MRRLTREQKDAIALFRDFREEAPGRIVTLDVDIPTALAVMGRLEYVGYRTTHGRRSKLYKHEFAPGSRPLLCAGPTDNQLYILQGSFRVTDRGIVDLDRRGREIDDESERYDDE